MGNTVGFNNPLTGLNGALILPQVKSPNFNLAGQTGWAILKNGNAYFFNVVASGTITASEFIGTDFIIDTAGAFFYTGPPALGNLFMSIASVAGTDGFGNHYGAGLAVVEGSSQIITNILAGVITQQFLTGNSHVSASGYLQAGESGVGAAEIDQLLLSSAANTTNNDTANLILTSNNDNDTLPAAAVLAYNRTGGGQQNYLTVSCDGAQITAGAIGAVTPGTGTVASPAVAETWHNAVITNANWTTVGAATPVRYRLLPDGNVQLHGEVLTTGAGPWPANTTLFTLPTGYQPAHASMVITRSDIAVGATADTVSVLASGSVQNGQAFTAAGQRLFFDGVIFPLT
jgi:hypothetical protein